MPIKRGLRKKRLPVIHYKSRYARQILYTDLLREVADEFINDGYNMHACLKEMINDKFEWEASSIMSPFLTVTTSPASINKWILFGKCRTDVHKSASCGKKKIVYIADSQLDDAGQGLFAGRVFLIGSIITVYLGENRGKGERKCNEGIYVMTVNAKTWVEPAKDMLLLGGHKCNNIEICSEETALKNNAKFVGIYLIATKKILEGQEIFASYT